MKEEIQELRNEIAQIKQRLEDVHCAKTSNALQLQSTVYALQQFAREASVQLGYDEGLVWSRIQEVGRWHLDRLLQKATDTAPSFAARIDARHPDEVPTDEYPPIILPQK